MIKVKKLAFGKKFSGQDIRNRIYHKDFKPFWWAAHLPFSETKSRVWSVRDYKDLILDLYMSVGRDDILMANTFSPPDPVTTSPAAFAALQTDEFQSEGPERLLPKVAQPLQKLRSNETKKLIRKLVRISVGRDPEVWSNQGLEKGLEAEWWRAENKPVW